jgi:hypothetical protein
VDAAGRCYRAGFSLNSSPMLLRGEGGRLYLYYATRTFANYHSGYQVWTAQGQLNAMRLDPATLSPDWVWKEGSDNQARTLGGWFIYWPRQSDCNALYYTLKNDGQAQRTQVQEPR